MRSARAFLTAALAMRRSSCAPVPDANAASFAASISSAASRYCSVHLDCSDELDALRTHSVSASSAARSISRRATYMSVTFVLPFLPDAPVVSAPLDAAAARVTTTIAAPGRLRRGPAAGRWAVRGEWSRARARACGAMGERRTGVDIVAMRCYAREMRVVCAAFAGGGGGWTRVSVDALPGRRSDVDSRG